MRPKNSGPARRTRAKRGQEQFTQPAFSYRPGHSPVNRIADIIEAVAERGWLWDAAASAAVDAAQVELDALLEAAVGARQ